MSEIVTIHRRGAQTGEDGQGNPTYATSDIAVAAIAIAPLAGTETAENIGSVSVNGYTLYLPFGADIRPTDFLTVRGIDGWHVEADASQADWASPFSDWKPGTVAT